MTGEEVRPYNEPKTFLYQDDLIKAYDRQLKFKDKVRNIFMNEF